MSRIQIRILIVCMIFGVCVLYSLYALSPFAADIPRQPFKRDFRPGTYVTRKGQIDLKVNSFYIAGASQNTVYLGNWTGPFHLVQVTIPTLDTLHMNMSVKDLKDSINYQVFRMKVDSPYFYLSHGVLPGIYKGLLSDRTAKSFLQNGSPYFVEATPISPTRFVVKSLSSKTNVNELATLTLDAPFFEFKPEVLEQQVDGVFCVDGMLNYNRSNNRLVYVYAYRNEFIVMDTILNVISRFHTIDTFRTANVKVAKIKSKNYSTLATPPSRTNIKSIVSSDLLFIQSPFLSENENKIEFQNGCPIDVYNINSGKYLYSFYINAFEGRLPSSLTIIGNSLVAIFDHFLVLYELTLPGVS